MLRPSLLRKSKLISPRKARTIATVPSDPRGKERLVILGSGWAGYNIARYVYALPPLIHSHSSLLGLTDDRQVNKNCYDGKTPLTPSFFIH